MSLQSSIAYCRDRRRECGPKDLFLVHSIGYLLYPFSTGYLVPASPYLLGLSPLNLVPEPSNSADSKPMTLGTLPPPTVLSTGLNVHSFLDFCEDLDTDSAGSLARTLNGN